MNQTIKHLFRIIPVAILVILTLFSCRKDEDDTNPNTDPNPQERVELDEIFYIDFADPNTSTSPLRNRVWQSDVGEDGNFVIFAQSLGGIRMRSAFLELDAYEGILCRDDLSAAENNALDYVFYTYETKSKFIVSRDWDVYPSMLDDISKLDIGNCELKLPFNLQTDYKKINAEFEVVHVSDIIFYNNNYYVLVGAQESSTSWENSLLRYSEAGQLLSYKVMPQSALWELNVNDRGLAVLGRSLDVDAARTIHVDPVTLTTIRDTLTWGNSGTSHFDEGYEIFQTTGNRYYALHGSGNLQTIIKYDNSGNFLAEFSPSLKPGNYRGIISNEGGLLAIGSVALDPRKLRISTIDPHTDDITKEFVSAPFDHRIIEIYEAVHLDDNSVAVLCLFRTNSKHELIGLIRTEIN